MLVFHYKCIFIWYSSLVKMYGSRHLIKTGWKVIGMVLYGLSNRNEDRQALLFGFYNFEKDGSRIYP